MLPQAVSFTSNDDLFEISFTAVYLVPHVYTRLPLLPHTLFLFHCLVNVAGQVIAEARAGPPV